MSTPPRRPGTVAWVDPDTHEVDVAADFRAESETGSVRLGPAAS